MNKPMPPKPPGSDDEFVPGNVKRGAIRLSREDRDNLDPFDWKLPERKPARLPEQ